MGAADKATGGGYSKAKDKAEGLTEAPGDYVNQKTGLDWNPMTSLNEEMNNPGSAWKGAAADFGGNVSNAWKTSVNDPLAKLGDKATQAFHAMESWFGKSNKLGSINDLPPVTMPGMVGGVGGAPGGGAGGVGTGGFTPIANQQIAIPGMAGAAGGGAPGAPNQFRDQQLALTQQLQNQAMGVGPSIAENQLRAAQEQNLAQTIAMANSAPGGNNPANLRNAMQQNAQIQGGLATQAATARLQEQQQAAQLLGQTAGAGRQSDFAQQQLGTQTAVEQAKLNQQTAQMNADLQKAYGELQAKYAAMGLDAQKANQLAALEIQKLQQQGALGYAGLVAGSDQAITGAVLGGLGTLLGGAAALSDARQKEDVKPGDQKVQDFLNALTVNDYKYKDEKFGKGRFVSVMAQDLEKTDLGKSMVVETEHGKMVDYGKGFGALLAAQASLNKRLAAMEKKGKK